MANVYTLKQLTDAVRQVESGGEKDPTRAINPKSGARGDMQVMPETLYKPEYGVTPAKDDSPEEVSRVGRDYLKAMVKRFGQEAGLVAYNWGPKNAKKWIKGGRDKNKLPDETQDYLVKVNNILAGSTKGRRKISQMATDKWKKHSLYRQWVKANKLDRTKAVGERRDLYNKAKKAIQQEKQYIQQARSFGQKGKIEVPDRIANSASAARQIVKAYEAKPPTAAEIAGMAKGVVDYWTYATLPASIGGIVSLGRGAYRLFNAAGKQFGKVFKSKAAALEAGTKAKPPPRAAPPQPPRIASPGRGLHGKPIQRATDQPRVKARETVKQQKAKAKAAREAREARQRAEDERIRELSQGTAPRPVPRPSPIRTPTRTARPDRGLHGGPIIKAKPLPKPKPNGKPKPKPNGKPKKRLGKLVTAHPYLTGAAIATLLGIPAIYVTKKLADRYRVNPQSAQRKAAEIKAKIAADKKSAAAKKTAAEKAAAAKKAAAKKAAAARAAEAARLVNEQKARKTQFPAQKYPPHITEGMSRSIAEILNSAKAKDKKNGKDRSDAKKPGWFPWDWIRTDTRKYPSLGEGIRDYDTAFGPVTLRTGDEEEDYPGKGD